SLRFTGARSFTTPMTRPTKPTPLGCPSTDTLAIVRTYKGDMTMQRFYIHRTQPAYVTEIIEVEAESNSAARQCAIDGVGDTTIGLVVGDYLDAPDTVEVFDAAPHNIPMGFLPINGEAA